MRDRLRLLRSIFAILAVFGGNSRGRDMANTNKINIFIISTLFVFVCVSAPASDALARKGGNGDKVVQHYLLMQGIMVGAWPPIGEDVTELTFTS